MGEEELSPEINNINVAKAENDKFKIVFGTATGIANLYSATSELEVDRALLEQFVKSAQEALAK